MGECNKKHSGPPLNNNYVAMFEAKISKGEWILYVPEQ